MKKISQPFLVFAACVALLVVLIIVFAQYASTGTVSEHREKIYPYKSSETVPEGPLNF